MDNLKLPIEQLMVLATRNHSVAREVTSLPDSDFDTSAYAKALRVTRDFYKLALQTEPYKVTPTEVKAYTRKSCQTPMEAAASSSFITRLFFDYNAKNDTPMQVKILLDDHKIQVKKAVAVAQLKGDNPAEAIETLTELGIKPKAVENLATALSKKSKGKATLKLTCFQEIEEKPMEWLWQDIIPLGGITVIAGEGESGKSTLVSSLISRITTGEPFPDGSPSTPVDTLYIGIEEDVERILRPRLRLFGANLRAIHYTPGKSQIVDGKEKLLPFTFADIEALSDTLKNHPNIKIVIFDPIGSYFGSADSYVDTQVQTLLQPLNKLAQAMGVTILMIAHLNKGETKSLKNRVMGSAAITNTARCVIGVLRDKVNQTSYMGITKCNAGGRRSTLPFSIGEGTISFDAEIDRDIDEMVKTTQGSVGRNANDEDVARDMIQALVGKDGLDSVEVEAKLDAVGISRATTFRAAKALTDEGKLIRGKRTGTFPNFKSRWTWNDERSF